MLLSNMSANECSIFELIGNDFGAVHKYEVTLDMLSTYHNITKSMHTLKTCLKEAGLFQRKENSPQAEVRRAILSELCGPGRLWGYQTMWQVLQQKHKLRVKCDAVMRLLQQLHPRGGFEKTEFYETHISLHGSELYMAHRWLQQTETLWLGPIRKYRWLFTMWLVCGNTNPSDKAHNYIMPRMLVSSQ